VAAAAYRAGVKLEDLRTAQVFDFTRRSGVVLADIVASANAGEFARDRAALWNAAEMAEKRKDSRTAREWILALPDELDAEQRVDLAREFAWELVDRYGVVADVAIHAPSQSGDDRNHHAHILCTTRIVAGDVLGEKCALELSDAKRKTLGLGSAADEISAIRERWAELANAALEKAGSRARIDHRSLADQQAAAFERGNLAEALALDRPAQVHVGVHATQLDRRSGQVISLRGRKRERAEQAACQAAFSAAWRAPVLIDTMRPEAEALVRAEIGSVWTEAEAGPAAANDVSIPTQQRPVVVVLDAERRRRWEESDRHMAAARATAQVAAKKNDAEQDQQRSDAKDKAERVAGEADCLAKRTSERDERHEKTDLSHESSDAMSRLAQAELGHLTLDQLKAEIRRLEMWPDPDRMAEDDPRLTAVQVRSAADAKELAKLGRSVAKVESELESHKQRHPLRTRLHDSGLWRDRDRDEIEDRKYDLEWHLEQQQLAWEELEKQNRDLRETLKAEKQGVASREMVRRRPRLEAVAAELQRREAQADMGQQRSDSPQLAQLQHTDNDRDLDF
jgi:hypothetical protein